MMLKCDYTVNMKIEHSTDFNLNPLSRKLDILKIAKI